MGFFNDVGTFFTKTIPNVVTKEIPKLVTKEIPKIITKDIPRIVTKDIPNLVVKEIPEVFTEDIPKLVTNDIPNLVTKGIPNLVTKEIPRVITKDLPKLIVNDIPDYFSEDIREMSDRTTYKPAIASLRKNVDGFERKIEANRSLFIEQRAIYDENRTTYRQLSEDYSGSKETDASRIRVAHVADEDWDDLRMGGERVLKSVDNSFRFVLNFVTLGIAEVAWTPGEAKKEYQFLCRREASLRSVAQRLGRANQEMVAANKRYDAAIALLRKELDVTGDNVEDALNDAKMAKARHGAMTDTAIRLFKNGADARQVELFTGLDGDSLSALEKAHKPAEATAETIATEEVAAELIKDGMPNLNIKALTNLGDDAINELRIEADADNTKGENP